MRKLFKTHHIVKIFFLALCLRMILPWISFGFVQMDEHWQVIEPANSLLGHTWSKAAEYQEGLRNWIYPFFVSLLLRLAEIFGFQDPLWINSFVRMMHGIVSSFSVFIVYFSVYRFSKKQNHALIAALFTASWPYALYCGFHTHGEMFGAIFGTMACVMPLFFKPSFAFLMSGFCFGIALALKIDVAVLGLGFGIFQLLNPAYRFKNRIRHALFLLLGVLPFIFLVGFTDKIYWGQWFNSVLGHAKVNLVDGVGNQWGVSPWYQHLLYYFDIGGVLVLATTLFLPFVYKKIPQDLLALFFSSFFFIAIFSFIPHKEKRFMSPLIYISIITSWSLLSKTIKLTQYKKQIISVFFLVLSIHAASNAYTYLIKQPWKNRISAIRTAGFVPGAEIAIAAQWPLEFYLPRHMPSMVFESTHPDYIRKILKPYRHFSLAADWGHLWPIENHGFHCEPWPKAKPAKLIGKDDIPWTYSCKKQ